MAQKAPINRIHLSPHEHERDLLPSASSTWQPWFREDELRLSHNTRLVVLHRSERSALLVKHYRRVDRINTPRKGVPFCIDIRESIVASAVSEISISGFFEETA